MKKEKTRENIKKYNRTEGITLVALIITIIVMLVLISATVNIIIQSELITIAENASNKMIGVQDEEDNLGNGVKIQDNAYSSVDEYITVIEGNSISNIIKPAMAINKYMKSNTNLRAVVQTKTATKTYEAPIPSGYTASKATGEGNILDGLVIYEGETDVDDSNVNDEKTNRSQFVWIPVENINDMYICQRFNTDYDGIEGISTTEKAACEFKIVNEPDEDGNIIEKIKCDKHGSYSIAGYVYAVRSSNPRPTTYVQGVGYVYDKESYGEVKISMYTQDTGSREPDVCLPWDTENLSILATVLEDNENYKDIETFRKTLQNEYNDIAKSILKYGGFYCGRYETSGLKQAESGYNVKVVAGASITKNVNWYYSYAQQKKYKLDDEAVGSTMINGVAYDQVIQFIAKDPNFDPYNYGKVGHTSASFSEKPYETGGTNYNSIYSKYIEEPYRDYSKNIYDLEGNISVWTTEAGIVSEKGTRTGRGGTFSNNGIAWRQSAWYPYLTTLSNSGTMCELYIR